MKSPSILPRVASFLAILALVASTASGQGQSPTKEVFSPQVGQAGKDVIWVPTPDALVEKMLDLAKVTAQDVVMDLGSGDGRTVIAAAKRGARAKGIEYDPNMVELSKQNALQAGVAERATFVKADLFETDFSEATVITMFLLPDINRRLRPKILDLKPGTRIVSNSFSMGEWAEDGKATIDDCTSWCNALLWIVPAKVAGTWRLPDGELVLQQEFQVLTGTLTRGGKTVPVSEGRMKGTEISFTAGPVRYTGRVETSAMSGTTASTGTSGGAGGAAWNATLVR